MFDLELKEHWSAFITKTEFRQDGHTSTIMQQKNKRFYIYLWLWYYTHMHMFSDTKRGNIWCVYSNTERSTLYFWVHYIFILIRVTKTLQRQAIWWYNFKSFQFWTILMKLGMAFDISPKGANNKLTFQLFTNLCHPVFHYIFIHFCKIVVL